MAGYDPKKAAEYNKLRQQGLSDEAAFKQSGISDADADNYVVNDVPGDPGRGTIGPVIFGSGTISQAPTAAEQKESAQFYKGLESNNFERVDYPVKADSNPSNKTPINYTTTSTEQVSGGGSTTITAPQPLANDTSRAIQAQADAKSVELRQYLADNPRNGNYTPEQAAARREKIDSLVAERGKLASQAAAAETPQDPVVTTTPNTTTNTSTVTYSQSSTNSDVETTAGPDPALNQEPSLDNTQVQSSEPRQVPVEQSLAPGEEIVPTTAPEPQQIETFNEGQSTITTVTDAPAPQTFEAGGGGGNQGTITRVTYQPEDVPPTEDPAAGATEAAATGGNESTVNIGTDENRGGNLEKATLQRAQEQAAIQAQFQSPASGDWRVRLRLAPQATYLYKDSGNTILAPLLASDGVVFPYMPTIQTSYNAGYDSTDLTHSNYRGYFYKNSYVGDISLTGTFTAQDTVEANYLLAVIHFFRSVTKMFYGQDAERGAPPPLVYLIGLGEYQFNNQPCVVSSFNYSLPNDVDYIRTKPNNYNINLGSRQTKTDNGPFGQISSIINRLKNAALPRGAVAGVPDQSLVTAQSVTNIDNNTYVPTRMDIQLTLLPMQTRNQQSQQFSVKQFANGNLLKGGFW